MPPPCPPLSVRLAVSARVRVPLVTVAVPPVPPLPGFTVPAPVAPLHPAQLVRTEHPGLREDQVEDGIVRCSRPIHKLRQYVIIHPKRKHPGDGPHGVPFLPGERPELRDPGQVLPGEDSVPSAHLRNRDHLLGRSCEMNVLYSDGSTVWVLYPDKQPGCRNIRWWPPEAPRGAS